MTQPTPRRIRLIRADGPRALQHAIAALCEDAPGDARRVGVLVPTRSAAALLRETLAGTPEPMGPRCPPPDLMTRQEWYGRLHEALPGAPPRLSAVEREVLLAAAARAATSATPPPFTPRPGLIAAMLAFYDTLLANRRTLERLESFLVADLEPRVDIDRGAERLLRQTRFLVAAFRDFQARQAASGGIDDDGLRRALLASDAPGPHEAMVVAAADRAADPGGGLYAADYDLLARLPGVRRVTLVATSRSLAAGLGDRLHAAFPDLDEEAWHDVPEPPASPGGESPRAVSCRRYRDREEELRDVAARFRRLAPADPPTAGDGQSAPVAPRLALVFGRPLPYVYLARSAFADAGLAVVVSEALPLAAEPFAALIEQLFQAASSRFGRTALVGLLRSPHLAVEVDERVPDAAALSALERALLDEGYAGNPRRLAELASRWTGDLAHAARAAVLVATELSPLTLPAPVSAHVAAVRAFLAAHERTVEPADPLAQRHLRARAAALAILDAVAEAAARFDDPPIPLETTAAQVRRWMEGQTFAPREPGRVRGGVHLLDARAACFGAFDVVHLAGLVAGEWPEPMRHEILYPSFLLSQLGWPAGGEAAAAARAGFEDLLQLARRETSVSTFLLEDDTIVEPSPLLDAVAGDAAPGAPTPAQGERAGGDAAAGGLQPSGEWQAIRTGRTPRDDPRYHGQAGAARLGRLSVSAIDRYLDCPFKYFAANVLRLEEEPEGDPALAPKARGIFVHELFRAFFSAWQREGDVAVTADALPRARALFARVAEEQLRSLPPGEAAAERVRLLGSAAAPGLGEVVFEAEAASALPVTRRLLEYPFDGTFVLEAGGEARRVRLRGTIDRVDLLAGGRLRVVDYKTGRAPAARSIQLPAYLLCVAQALSGGGAGSPDGGEALYVAFGEADPVRWVVRGDGDRAVLDEAVTRVFAALDGIAAGSFPPRPAERRLCATCGFRSVCRKDYVDAE